MQDTMSNLRYLIKTRMFHHYLFLFIYLFMCLKNFVSIFHHTQMNAGKIRPTLLLNRHYIKPKQNAKSLFV